MKNIFLATIFAAGAIFTSCDMDMKPYGSLDDETAIQTVNDCYRFRNGLYSSMRGLATGSYVYFSDIQMDQFQGTTANGNRLGIISQGEIYSSDGDITGYWSGLYSVINSANYIIEKMENLKATAELSASDLAALSRYDGEAHFVRAYCYYWLADHFCETYSAENAQAAAKGLPLVTVYHPTGDLTSYPGRSTQDETYKLINDDLTAAYNALVEFEKTDNSNVAPNASYLSSYAVLALQARIALLKGDNETALAKAETVINSGIYPLTELADYKKLWADDEGTEVIFRPFMSATELGNSTGGTYLATNEDNADYIPTYDVLNMYGEGDVRFDAYFTIWELTDSKVQAYVFTKYPGNIDLRTTPSTPNYMNMSKPFRTSELYLIAAEAAATTNPTLANKYLNDLRSKRIEGYENGSYSGQNLINAIREERQKELIGEGFRMSDLRRWGLGFQRNPSHPENPQIESILVTTSSSVSYEAGDHRYVWPIPSDEIQTNLQMQGQQNPGY